MAVVKLTYEQEQLVQNVARKVGFINYDIESNVGSSKGDNYLGIIATVTLKEKNNGKVLHLLLKSAQTDENFRKQIPMIKAFERESYLYEIIIPQFTKFQDEYAVTDPFTGAAKYYGSCLKELNESILMDNLKEQGFKLWDRKLPMNDEHVTLVFSEYARFHAVSLALRNKRPEEFDELTKDIQKNIFEKEEVSDEFDMFIDVYFQAGYAGVEGNIKAKTALEKFHSNVKTFFLETLKDKEDQIVITHGDCWCNNLLFQYKETNSKPTKVCFIDWQLSKLGSPVLDLSYFFCVCSSVDVLRNLPKYLKIYHDILSQNLKNFGCDPEEVFSFDMLMYHWKKNAKYGVFMAMMILKLMLSDSDEAPDMTKAVNEGKSIVDAFDFGISRPNDYKVRLCDLVEFMSDNNYI